MCVIYTHICITQAGMRS